MTSPKQGHTQHVQTPLDMTQMGIAILVQLCEALNITLLFPFLAFMVEDLGYSGKSLGTHAGALVASFCAAQFSSSVMWGMISDKYGRKPAVAIGTFGAAIGMLIFGTAKTYTQAILGRALCGFLSGNQGIVKSFLTEITDDSNRGYGFSLMSLAWSSGTILAPLAGGWLCKPVEKYPSIFHKGTVFDTYPYFLPCLLCVIVNVVASIICAFVMKETKFPNNESHKYSAKQVGSISNGSGSSSSSSSSSSTFSKLTGGRAPMDGIDNSVHGKYAVLSKEDDDDVEEQEALGGVVNKLHKDGYSKAPSSDIESGRRFSESGDTDLESLSPPDEDTKFLSKFANSSFGSSTEESDMYSRIAQEYDDVILEEEEARRAERSGLDGDIELTEIESQLLSKVSGLSTSHGSNSSSIDNSAEMSKSKHASKADEEEEEEEEMCCSTLCPAKDLDPHSTRAVLRQRTVVLTVLNYAMLAMAYIIYDETLPLFLKYDAHKGGFSFGSSEIGFLIAVSGSAMIAFSLLALPKIVLLKKSYIFRIGVLGGIPAALLWPALSILNHDYLTHVMSESSRRIFIWICLITIFIIKNILACLSFTAVMIMVNHSVSSEYLGAVNGLGQSLASLARSVGPAIGGLLWSFSTEYHCVFFNFILVVIVLIITEFINQRLPDTLENKKESKNPSSQASTVPMDAMTH